MKTWAPNSDKQASFLSLPDSIFEGLYGGAVGGGKTETLIYLPLIRGFHNYPSYKGISFRRTYKQLERSLILRAKEVYIAAGATYNANEYCFTWKSGAKHFFSYLETDDHARQHDTDEFNLICYEELTHFNEYQYLYLTTRCRTSTNLPNIMRSAATPGNIGHKWVYERFIKPCLEGNKILVDQHGNKRIFIPAKLTDNPDLTKNNPNYVNQLMVLPEAERKARIDGDWHAFEGQVFKEFRLKPGTGEPENARHIIPRFEIPDWWPKLITIDWGYDHKTAVYWIAVSPDGRAFVYREYITRKTKIRKWGAEIAQITQSNRDQNIVDIVLDPSAWGDKGTDMTVQEQIVAATGWDNIRKADNDRVGGKMLLHDYLRWEARPERYVPAEGYSADRAAFIYRNHGAQAWNDYEALFLPEPPETNIPRLQIFEQCTELPTVITQCVPDEKKPEDVAKFTGDDPYDALRYGIKAVDRYVDEAFDEWERRKDIGRIQADFERTKDWNKYYREMEFYEAHHKKSVGPVSRIHSAQTH